MVTLVNILEIAGLVMAAATAIARLTPSQKDDSWLEKARVFIEKISNMFLPNVEK